MSVYHFQIRKYSAKVKLKLLLTKPCNTQVTIPLCAWNVSFSFSLLE